MPTDTGLDQALPSVRRVLLLPPPAGGQPQQSAYGLAAAVRAQRTNTCGEPWVVDEEFTKQSHFGAEPVTVTCDHDAALARPDEATPPAPGAAVGDMPAIRPRRQWLRGRCAGTRAVPVWTRSCNASGQKPMTTRVVPIGDTQACHNAVLPRCRFPGTPRHLTRLARRSLSRRAPSVVSRRSDRREVVCVGQHIPFAPARDR